jgi:hypothetical protein
VGTTLGDQIGIVGREDRIEYDGFHAIEFAPHRSSIWKFES